MLPKIAVVKSKGKVKWMFIIVIGILILLAFFYSPAPLKVDEDKSINRLEKIDLGGTKQWISIRGQSVDNPILLFLHGGPGSANLTLLRTQCPDLEKHFVVVNWDQRGAGKSYSLTFDRDTLTIDQIVNDTHQLVLYLKDRFVTNKIYLMGFSWGSVPGITIVSKYPEDIVAYISIGQFVNPREGEKISLEYVNQRACETNNEVALDELEEIDPTYSTDDWYEQLMTQRKWLLAFGGVYQTRASYNHEASALVKAREYSLANFALWPLGSSVSLKELQPEVMKLDFTKTITQVDTPVYCL